MRTTLTIDNDIADYLREQSRLHEKPFKQVVNETLRRGMDLASGTSDDKPTKPFKVKPFPGGFAPGVDPMNPKDFLDQLDDEHFKVRTFSSGYAPGVYPLRIKDVLNELDDEYYDKKLA